MYIHIHVCSYEDALNHFGIIVSGTCGLYHVRQKTIILSSKENDWDKYSMKHTLTLTNHIGEQKKEITGRTILESKMYNMYLLQTEKYFFPKTISQCKLIRKMEL